MKTCDFESLCDRVMRGGKMETRGIQEADIQEDIRELIHQAVQLRLQVIWFIGESDRWDQDWDILGFEAYSDDGDKEYDAIRDWRRRLTELQSD